MKSVSPSPGSPVPSSPSQTFTIAFLEAAPISLGTIAFTTVRDALLVLDVVLRARFFAHWEGDVLRHTPSEIMRHYRRTNYVACQLIAALPMEAAEEVDAALDCASAPRKRRASPPWRRRSP